MLAELGAWAAARRRPVRTCSYGAGPDQVADLLTPPAASPHAGSPRGVAILIHGGFWQEMYRRDVMAALAIDLAQHGWASWNIEYRRVGAGGGAAQTLDDVRGALAAVRDWLPDGGPLIAIGHSAGGQLALCLAGEPSLRAVVSLAGVCDMAAAALERLGEGAAVQFMGGHPSERPEAYSAADPLARLPTGGRTLLVHGDRDDRVPVSYSRRYAEAASAAGDQCELLELAGVDHFELIDPRTVAWRTVAGRLDELARGSP